METCSCICIPRGEKGGMEIIASTQDLEGLQRNVCKALNVPRTKVTARVKAVGMVPTNIAWGVHVHVLILYYLILPLLTAVHVPLIRVI